MEPVVEQPVVPPPPGTVVQNVTPTQPVQAVPAAPSYVEPTVATQHVVTPVAPAAVVTEPAVVASDHMVRRSWSAFSISQIIHGIGAIILLVIGAVAVATGGFDGPASEQVGKFLGIEMTTPVGLCVLAAGLLLAIAALTPSGRPFGGFVGVLVAVGGIVIIAANPDLSSAFRADDALGWILLVVGIACVLGAFLPDEVRSRRRQVYVR